MKKRVLLCAGMFTVVLMLMTGCGKEKEIPTVEGVFSSMGLQTLPEVVGMDIPYTETYEDGELKVNYVPSVEADSVDEEFAAVRDLQQQFEDYLMQACDAKHKYDSDVWYIGDWSIRVMEGSADGRDPKNEKFLNTSPAIDVFLERAEEGAKESVGVSLK